jgi:hypothetical protein
MEVDSSALYGLVYSKIVEVEQKNTEKCTSQTEVVKTGAFWQMAGGPTPIHLPKRKRQCEIRD